MRGLWPFERRTSTGNADCSSGDGGPQARRRPDIESPCSPIRSHAKGSHALLRRGPVPTAESAAAAAEVTNGLMALAVDVQHQQQQHAESSMQRNNSGLQPDSSSSSLYQHANPLAAGSLRPQRLPHKQTSLPKDPYIPMSQPKPLGYGAAAAGMAWGAHAQQGPPASPGTPSPSGQPLTRPAHDAAASQHPPVTASREGAWGPAHSPPPSPSAASPDTAPLESPSGLRPCPPTSASGLRAESFTSGTSGRLLRPGVGIGAGTMRETRFEDLRLIQQIGEGGCGKVYYGHWNGSPVAIKVVTPHPEHPDKQMQEFQREVTNMSTLPPHANVLKLLAACFDPQHLALVTEFCSRGSLYNMLHAPGATPPAPHQRLAMWLGVARGMQHLHACRVLHRDLKSANLLLDDVGVVKIGDLGLSRVLSGQATQAMTGGLGTYQWMAPEVLTSQNYSEKADIYSFAMVMWESCTCKLPYEDMTAMQAGLRVATQGLRPEIPASVDPEQARLIRDCWAPVPDQRPLFPEVVFRLEAMLMALERPSTSLAASEPGTVPTSSSCQPGATTSRHESEEQQQQQQQQQQQGGPLLRSPSLQSQVLGQGQGAGPQAGQQPLFAASPPRHSMPPEQQQQQQQLSPRQQQQQQPPQHQPQYHSPPHPGGLNGRLTPPPQPSPQQPVFGRVRSPLQQRQRQSLSQPPAHQLLQDASPGDLPPHQQLVETLPGHVGHDSLQEQLHQEQRQWQQELAGGSGGEHVLITVGPPPPRDRSKYSPTSAVLV